MTSCVNPEADQVEAEIAAVKPQLVVCLGATAAQTLLGRTFSVTRQRGELLESKLAGRVMATVHPSSILRAPDDKARREALAAFVTDLRKVAGTLRTGRAAPRTATG